MNHAILQKRESDDTINDDIVLYFQHHVTLIVNGDLTCGEDLSLLKHRNRHEIVLLILLGISSSGASVFRLEWCQW